MIAYIALTVAKSMFCGGADVIARFAVSLEMALATKQNREPCTLRLQVVGKRGGTYVVLVAGTREQLLALQGETVVRAEDPRVRRRVLEYEIRVLTGELPYAHA